MLASSVTQGPSLRLDRITSCSHESSTGLCSPSLSPSIVFLFRRLSAANPSHLSDCEFEFAVRQTHRVAAGKMMSLKIAACTALVLIVLIEWSTAVPAGDKEAFMNQLNMVGDEESAAIERDLLNYLVGRRFVKRLRNQVDVEDLQRKRNYWRQCAFNAVSCFGK